MLHDEPVEEVAVPVRALAPVDRLCEQYVDDVAALDPVLASHLGTASDDSALTDLSPDGWEAREKRSRWAHAAVQAAVPSGPHQVLARSAFLERLSSELELTDAGLLRGQVNVVSTSLHRLRGVFDLMPTDGDEAWCNIDARLAQVPGVLAGYRATLREEAARGRVVAARQYVEVAAQVRAWTDADHGQDLLGAFVAGAGAAPTLQRQLVSHAAAATEAFAVTGRFLAEEMAPLGRQRDAVGRETYSLWSRQFLGSTIDLDDTYAWGWDELARISAEMGHAARQVAPDATGPDSLAVAVAIRALDVDPKRWIQGKYAFRAWMQDVSDRTIEQLDGVHVDLPAATRTLECCLAPTDDGGIYYTAPSEDHSRPGRMWWAVPPGQTQFSPWRELTTIHHEGVPGHHLQIIRAAAAPHLNRWQRLLGGVSGHAEGWALYAERLMDELGYLDDPADRLGMLDQQAYRAARVVVDIGMHLELRIPDNPYGFHPGERWTPALGLEFVRQHCRMNDAILRFELTRYLGWPGQAPSYKVGERLWLDTRAAAQTALGSAFDLRSFHRTALDLGPLGLDLVHDAVLAVSMRT